MHAHHRQGVVHDVHVKECPDSQFEGSIEQWSYAWHVAHWHMASTCTLLDGGTVNETLMIPLHANMQS